MINFIEQFVSDILTSHHIVNYFTIFFLGPINKIIVYTIFVFIFVKLLKSTQYKSSVISFIYLTFVIIFQTILLSQYFGFYYILSVIKFIILPIISLVLYYFIIIRKIIKINTYLNSSNMVLLNILPMISWVLIHLFTIYIMFLSKSYNVFIEILFSIIICSMILAFDFISYHIIFSNVEKHAKVILLNKDIMNTQEQVINAFSKVIEECSEPTGNHVKRVSEYTKVMCKAFEFF